MANCSEDQCENLVKKLKNISRTEITPLLDHFDKRLGANFKYFKNFKFLLAWLSDEYTSYTQDFSIYEAIESYLRIKEIQDKLSEFECSLLKQMDCVGQFPCPECGSQIKLNLEESLWNTLQAHRTTECAKHSTLIRDENNGNGELILKSQPSSSSSAGASTSVSLNEASTSQSERDFDESPVSATQITKKTDQVLQSLILPEDPLSTWCVQCAEKVPYSAVNQHLSQKCHQLPSELGGGASKKIVNYDDSVLKALYNGEMYNYTVLIDGVEFFIIQNLGPYKHCIICVENMIYVRDHIKSKAHKKLTNKESVQKLLKLYHDIWVCQPLHIQIQQKYFRKHEAGMICEMCSDTVAYTQQALGLHLESSKHRLHVLKNATVIETQFKPVAKSSESKTKSLDEVISDSIIHIVNNAKQHDRYPPELMEHVYAQDQSNLYTVQLKSSKSLTCLLCRIEFSLDGIYQLLIHLKSKKHKRRASKTSSNSYMALNSYHTYWRKNKKISFMEEDFWPVTDGITWCIKCGINLEYKHLYTHCQTFHVENVKDVDFSKLLHEDFNCFPSIYKTNIMKMIYPNNIPQYNIMQDAVSYPLIQTLKNVKKCILCTCLFKADVFAHLTSERHIKNANLTNVSRTLKRYHDIWTSKKYASVQEEQVYFFQKKKRLDCIFCACTIRRKEIFSHIQTKEHKAHVSTYISSSTYPTEHLVEDVLPLKGPNVNAMSENIFIIRPLVDIIKDHYVKLKGSLPSDDKTSKAKSYDPIVESILYPKPLIELAQELSNSNILSVRVQSRTHFCCLLCLQTEASPKFLLKIEVQDHIAGEKHLKKYTNVLMLSALEAYHNYWMQKPLENQLFQIDFIAVNATKCRCLICECILEYSNLRSHLKTKRHSLLASDQNDFLSLMESSAKLENSNPWKPVSDNTVKEISNETSQINVDRSISETANIDELNEISESNSLSNSDDYEDGDTMSESESDSVVSFRDATESDHSDLYGHHSDSVDFNEQQKQEDDLQQLKIVMKYDKLVEDTLFPDLQKSCIEIDGVKYPVFRVLENEGVICTICKDNPAVQSTTSYSKSKEEHTRRLNDANVLARFKRFHLFWMSQEASDQLLQKYFKTTDTDCKLKCHLCKTFLFYEDCIEHIKVFHEVTSKKKWDNENFTNFQVAANEASELYGNHSDSGDFNRQQKREDDLQQLKFVMKYDKLVEDTLYPDLQTDCIEIDGMEYPVFRILENEGVVCTICKGNPTVQSIMNHLESKAKHARRMKDESVLSRLKRFHLFWMSQEASTQLLQKYFKTTDDDCKLKCLVCQTLLFYEDCIEHVKVLHDVTSEEKRDNENFTFQVRNEASDSSSLSPAAVPGFRDNMNDKYKVPDFNFQFKFEMKYDKSVESKLYPAKLRKHSMLIDNIKYPIFRGKADGFECLLCNSIFKSIENHLNSLKHKCETQVHSSLTRLVNFHDFWMNLEPDLQLQHMYFGILDKNLCTCTLCDSVVTYEEVTTHVEHPQHKKFVDLKKQESTTQTPTISKQDLSQSNSSKSSPKPTAKPTPTSKTKQEHKTRKALSNPNSPVLLERMPERYKPHLHFLKANPEGSVSCLCCSVPLKADLINLKLHLKTKDHIENSKTPLTKFKFLCEICMKIYSSEDSWEKHLKENDHLMVLTNLGKLRRCNVLEYECVTCSLVIFGDKLSLTRHQQWNRSGKKKKELKLPEGVRRLFESKQHIEDVANQLIGVANHESQNQEKEKNCCLGLVSALKEIFPLCKAYPFGSRVMGLGGRDSDLDIFVDVDGMYTGNKLQNAEEQAIIVMEVKKLLRKSKPVFSHINPVPTARTPIIQVFHVPTGIDCDVSFRHGLSVENTAFIRLCIDLQPNIQGVLLVLKQWCKMCDLNNFSSYALTMMAIFYFQTQGYLLTIKELRAINSSAPITIDGWETIKYTASLSTMMSYLKRCSLSVKDLLHDFFEYFARFDYEKQVMCPLLGQSILKTCFNDNGINLPPEMKSYVQKIKQPDAELFRNRSPMCIQDPFDLSHNLTKACERSFLTKWRGYCELSAKHLSALH